MNNRGMIFGTVRNTDRAIVSLSWIGKRRNQLDAWNPRADHRVINLAYTKKIVRDGTVNNVFTIPFRWDGHNIGEYMDAQFRVFAVDAEYNKRGSYVGHIKVAPDWHQIALDVVPGKIKWTYVPQRADGTIGTEVTGSFDYKTD